MAKVDADLEQSRKRFVFLKQDVIVRRERFHFSESGFDAQKSAFHAGDRDGQDMFKEGCPGFSIHDDEEDAPAGLPRDDEVGLGIADTHSRIDFLGSFVDERPLGKGLRPRASSSPPLPFQEAIRFDPPAIYACDIPIDGVLRDRGELAASPHMPRNSFWRLVVIEAGMHFLPERIVLHDFHTLILRVSSPDVCLLVGFLRVVAAMDAVAPDFVPDSGRRARKRPSDVRVRIPLATQYADLITLAPAQVRVFYAWFL